MKNFRLLKIVFILSFLLTFSILASAQADIPRQTTAITYPQDEVVTLQFAGTTRFPRMKGEAKIKRTSKNGTEIELSVSKMPRPFELGAGYATYVLWAISPEGRVDNLGEIKRRGFWEFDSNISVTTPLQTFALMITAEPHFLVRSPSRAVMLENISPSTRSGRLVPITKSIQYFGNSSDYFRDSRTPEIAETDYSKTPSTILQAKQAVALARFAGAERDATEEFKQADSLLQNADNAWKAGRDEQDIDITARKAIGAAVKAEETAMIRKQAREKRNEKIQQDAELQKSEDRIADVQQQINDLRSELANEQRRRELSERDAFNYSEQVKQLRDENNQIREDLRKARNDAEGAKVQVARFEGEKQAYEKQRQEDNRVSQVQANIPLLMESLQPYGIVRQTSRGIVLTLSDTYWSGVRNSDFAASSESKLAGLGSILMNNRNFKIAIESHIDTKGAPTELQTLTDDRARMLLEKFISFGVDQTRIEAKGLGSAVPVASNDTFANRAKNRRVDVILIPNI